MKGSWRKKRAPFPILLVICVISMLGVLIISGFNYMVFLEGNSDEYMKNFIRYNERVTSTAFRNMDKQIAQTVLRIPQLYFSDIPENRPLLQPQEGNLSALETKDFAIEMNRLKNAYPFVVGMDLYYENSGIVVTGFTNVHFPENEERFRQYLPWYEDWENGEFSQGFLSRPEGVYASEQPVLTYVRELSLPKWKGKKLVLGMHISLESFGEYISESEGALAIMTKQGKILYDTAWKQPDSEEDRVPLSAEAILKSMEREGLGEDGEPFLLTVGNDPITVFLDDSSDSGLRYIYRIENDRLYQDYYEIRHNFLINFLLSIGFNVMLMALIAYYYYAAYRGRVLEASRKAGIQVDGARQSFDTSLNQLVREVSVLHTSWNSSKGLLFQSMVRSVIFNKPSEEALKKLEPWMHGDYVRVFFFYLPDQEISRLSVEKIQEEYALDKKEYQVLFTTLEKVSLVAVLFCEEGQKHEVDAAFAEEMTRRWEDCWVVSGLRLPLENGGIAASFKSALEAERYRFIFPEKKMISYEELETDRRKSSGSHLKIFEAMERDMNSGNSSDFKVKVEGLVVSFKEGNYSIGYCNSTLHDFVTMFYRYMQQNQLDSRVMFGYDIREYYRSITDINMFCRWGIYLGETIIETLGKQKKSVDKDLKDTIASFIEENLEKDLSLDLLADYLHLRLDAASRLFRQTMGKGYTEYTKERKLNKAIELLERGDSVKEIAERLGYSSSQYFIKVFKESYGITPHQYRKQRVRDGKGHN